MTSRFYSVGCELALAKFGAAVGGVSAVSGVSGTGTDSPASSAGNAMEKKMTTGIRSGVGDIISAPSPPGAPKPNPAGVPAGQRSAT